VVKFKIFNAKNKKEVNLIKVLGKHISLVALPAIIA
jgi:hypothetical protein